MSTIIQRSFSGGEIHPRLYPRADLARYFTSAKRIRNAIVQHQGGVSNRSGFGFGGVAKNSKIKLIDFVHSDSVAYSLEFGHQYMRVVKGGEYIKNSALSIEGISQANPAVFTITGHGLTDGKSIYITGLSGDLGQYLNGRYGIIKSAATDTFQIEFPEGDFDSSGLDAYVSGGSVEEIYEIVTPWDEDDLDRLYYDQSADVMTLVHKDYAPAELSRTADDNWSIATSLSFDPSILPPQIMTASGGSAGSTKYYVQITATNSLGEESYPANFMAGTISSISNANPGVVTYSIASGLIPIEDGQIVQITSTGVVALTNYFRAKYISSTTFSLYDLEGNAVDTTSMGTISFGLIYADILSFEHADLSPSDSITYTWSHFIPVGFYDWELTGFNIYRKRGQASFGLVGITNANARSFEDVGVDPDTSLTPPVRNYDPPFSSQDNYPGTLAYYQQRRLLSRPNNNQEQVRASRINAYKNFTASVPIKADDAFSFTLRGKRFSEIRHLIDNGSLIIFTANEVWNVKGGDGGALTPSDINAVRQSYIGSSYLEPIVVDDMVIFMQAIGTKVRGLNYDFSVDGYRGNDLSIFASHLLDGYEIIDWCYQATPDSVLWLVRDDGVLLGMTFVREQQIIAWHRHDLKGGFVESICCIPEGGKDVVYAIVKRKINGVWVKYHERMSDRFVSEDSNDFVDNKFLDSFLSYDGRNTDNTHTMILTGGTTWDNGEPLNLESSKAYFESSDVGNEIQLWIKDELGNITDRVSVEITGFTDSENVTVNPLKEIPESLQGVAVNTWARAVDEILGLWHLEGENVSVQGDGYVVASPYNEVYEEVTVENGKITLDECYAVIHVGLPYITDIQTLSPDTTQAETTINKAQLFSELHLFVEKTNSFWAGPRLPTDDDVDALEDMRELTTRDQNTDPNAYPELVTDVVELNISGQFKPDGSIVVRQVDPAPLSVQAIAPSGMVPIGGE